MDEAVVLVEVGVGLDKERVDSAVNIDEFPELVEHGLVKGDAQNDLLENLNILTGNEQDRGVNLGQ